MLTYLKAPRPELSYYESAAAAEQAYLNLTTSADVTISRVVGVDFTDTAAASTVHYSLRFKASDVADTKTLFNHARKKLLSFLLCSFCLWFTETLGCSFNDLMIIRKCFRESASDVKIGLI